MRAYDPAPASLFPALPTGGTAAIHSPRVSRKPGTIQRAL